MYSLHLSSPAAAGKYHHAQKQQEEDLPNARQIGHHQQCADESNGRNRPVDL
jgi:hypothetical protein